jgi:O-acetyl-ADP-ribose deacetylase (regulator of RNase III)
LAVALRVKMLQKELKKGRLVLLQGDITTQDADAIVNAANSSLLGGGGVDGAIHRAGGAQILEECRAIRARRGECPAGEAVITGGGALKARFIIHAVGPVWRGGQKGEAEILQNAYRNSLRLAEANGAVSVAFPSISTGAYGFPIEEAVPIAVDTVSRFLTTSKSVREVRFVAFSREDYEVYAKGFRATASGETAPQK